MPLFQTNQVPCYHKIYFLPIAGDTLCVFILRQFLLFTFYHLHLNFHPSLFHFFFIIVVVVSRGQRNILPGSHFLYCHVERKKSTETKKKKPVVIVAAAAVVELVGVRLGERHGGEPQKHTRSPFTSSNLFRLSDIFRAFYFMCPAAAAGCVSGSFCYSPQNENVNTNNPMTPGTHQCFCCLFPHFVEKDSRKQDGQSFQSLDTKKPFK